jgi:membrane-associated phospholipid phosphatase
MGTVRHFTARARGAGALLVGAALTAAASTAWAQGSVPFDAPATEAPPPPGPQAFAPPSPRDEATIPSRLEWNPAWSRFSIPEWFVTGVAAGTALTFAIIALFPRHAQGGVLFDESVRDALRVSGRTERYVIRDTSDVGVSLLTTWPFFVDALISAWWRRGGADVAREMALIDAETLSIAAAIQGATNTIASRERPYGRTCGSDLPEQTIDCEGNVRYRSFFSGHSTFAFASAGLVCTHHIKLELLGGPYDALSCGGALAVAGMTATFRVMGDMHYATDAITGALLGSALGFGIPLLHYGFGHSPAPAFGRVQLGPAAGGAALTGTF